MAKKKEAQVEIVVLKRFRDKNNHKTHYEVGSKLKFDESRANDVVERGLAELYIPEEVKLNIDGDGQQGKSEPK